MYIKYCILILAVLWFSSPVYAEFYKYKDTSGVTRFTDNLAEVPKDQRPKVKSYVEPDDFLSEEEKAERDKNSADDVKQEKTNEQEAAKRSQVENLKKQRIDLDKEYKDILKTKQQLDKERASIMKPDATPEARKSLEDKIKNFNKRTEAYEKNQSKYQQEVDTFNKQIEEYNKK